jgi:hypothetical protein
VIVFGLLSKAIVAVGAAIAVFAVAWYFYIHDHAARTDGGVATSLSRELDADRASCRDRSRGSGWICVVSDESDSHRYVVRPRGAKNCWTLDEPGRDVQQGCVKVLDYVRGFL